MSDSNIGSWFYDEPDPIAKAYEDNYWAERDAAITYQAFAHATDTWSPETADLFLEAVRQAGVTRAEERDEVIESLLS